MVFHFRPDGGDLGLEVGEFLRGGGGGVDEGDIAVGLAVVVWGGGGLTVFPRGASFFA